MDEKVQAIFSSRGNKMFSINQKVLCIDVGKGTEDILFYETKWKETPENCIQIVKPSRAQLLNKKLARFREEGKGDVFADGRIMGGEPWHKQIYAIAQDPTRSVYMTPPSAMSLRYDLKAVQARGITIVNDLPEDILKTALTIETKDVDYDWLFNCFEGIDINLKEEVDVVLLACQEHGNPGTVGTSSRTFRMKFYYQQHLDKSPRLSSLMFASQEVPEAAPRLKANVEAARETFPDAEIYIMDSSPAVILGTIVDQALPKGPRTIVNIGNGHTLAMVLDEQDEVLAIWEHHTSGLTTSTLWKFLTRLFNDEMDHEDLIQQGGHGYYQRGDIPKEATRHIIVLGPNRKLLPPGKRDEAFIYWAHPIGAQMLSGPVGLLKTYEEKKFKNT